MLTVKVYPTKASALNVKHPHGHQMTLDGVIWPRDSFTGRRLADGSVTEHPVLAYKLPAPEATAEPVVSDKPAAEPGPVVAAEPEAEPVA